jgi:sugar-specific transcriptional regulator TrmB
MTPSISDILHELDLTEGEIKIYLAILQIGTSTISEIARETQLNRRNIYDTISTLLDKGLIFQIIGERHHSFGSTTPEKLIELIESKEIALQGILPELKRMYQSDRVQEHVMIYKGLDGFRRYQQDILHNGVDVFCIGAKGGWDDPALGDFSEWFEAERVKRKIKTYNLFDHELRDHLASRQPRYQDLAEHRFLPPAFSTNAAIDIFADHIVIFSGLSLERLQPDVTLFVMIDQELANTYRTWFRFMWDHAIKANAPGQSSS